MHSAASGVDAGRCDAVAANLENLGLVNEERERKLLCMRLIVACRQSASAGPHHTARCRRAAEPILGGAFS